MLLIAVPVVVVVRRFALPNVSLILASQYDDVFFSMRFYFQKGGGIF